MTENSTLPGAPGDAAGREFHAVADLFPLMRGEAFEELAADIKKNGLREAILVDAEGRILDGRNRYRACLKAGVEPRFVEWQGEGPLADLALSLNLRRRHLDESQRAMVAARLAKMMAAKRKGPDTDRWANLPIGQFKTSRDQAAVMVNVSARLVNHASKVINNGGDELIAAVESGGLVVSAASVLAGLPKDEQAKTVAGGAKHAASKAREIRGTQKRAEPLTASPGRFGVMRVETPGQRGDFVVHGMAFFWVDTEGLADAVAALKARGFQDAG